MNITMVIDTLWVMLAAVLVFFMNLGFAAVESGMARSKNTVNILSKNFIVFAVSSLGFMLLGWGLMFGGDNPFVGTQQLFILGNSHIDFYKDTLTSNVPFWGKFFFQLVFCGTAATIVSGAVAERVKYISFIVFSFILTLVIYPVVGHWIWGGGWLANLGFLDFAGDTVVHSVGGWAALAGALLLGPRHGKYDKNGKPKAIPGHNMSLAVTGLFVLWLGWFGFNPGSTMSFQNPGDVVHVFVTTNTAAIAAILTVTATSWFFIGKPDLGMTINGCLAGLVAITGSCAYVSVTSSLIIGAIAGVLVVFSVLFFDRVKVDDPVGATSVHLVCGIFGTICVGLFAQEGVTSLSAVNGLFFGGGLSLLGIEALGIIAVGAFVFASSAVVWFLLKSTTGIRVSLEEEIRGLDIGEHGNSAYPDFAIIAPVMGSVNGYEREDGTVAAAIPARMPKHTSGAVSPPVFGVVSQPISGEVSQPVSGTVSQLVSGTVSPEVAIPVVNLARSGAKITKVTIITNQDKFPRLQSDLDKIGITGLTVTNVLGYGMQKGYTEYYRGVPVKTRLLPKIQIDIVVCKVLVETLVGTVKRSLYTGNVGDGKIFIYDVENVIKIRTGEEGYDALQDEDNE